MIKELSLYARFVLISRGEHRQGKDNEVRGVHCDREYIEPDFCFEEIKGKHGRE